MIWICSPIQLLSQFACFPIADKVLAKVPQRERWKSKGMLDSTFPRKSVYFFLGESQFTTFDNQISSPVAVGLSVNRSSTSRKYTFLASPMNFSFPRNYWGGFKQRLPCHSFPHFDQTNETLAPASLRILSLIMRDFGGSCFQRTQESSQ